MSTVDHDERRQQFVVDLEGYQARLDYVLNGRVMTITHTGVPPQIGGRGVAADLTHTALATAVQRGWSVVPACSYVAAYIRRHPGTCELEQGNDEVVQQSGSEPPASGGIL